MKTILFAPATFNLAETTRMIEIAKQMRLRFFKNVSQVDQRGRV